MPMNHHAAPEDEDRYIQRSTGPRRSEPAACYVCGLDMPPGPTFGDVTCGKPECREAAARR
jgi:hypothetical protein